VGAVGFVLRGARPPAEQVDAGRQPEMGVCMTEVDATEPSSAAPEPPDARPRLSALVWHIFLSLLTAVFVPALLLYVCSATVSVWAALVAALAWCYGVSAWRVVTRRRTSGLLILTVIVLTARTAFAFASGDTFVYFLQPAVTDLLLAMVFLASLATARPVAARLAPDFYPMTADVATRSRIRRLFWYLTFLWAIVCLGRAALTVLLLVSQSTMDFIAITTISLPTITAVAVAATVFLAVRVARKEGLLPAT
jgi:hypothetical protein